LHNVRDNLYSCWTLANICDKLGIHFTYVGTNCLYSHSAALLQSFGEGIENLNIEEWNGENRYTVTKNFTDLSIASFQNLLNVRFQLPFSDENVPQNFLHQLFISKHPPTLLNMNQAYSITHLPSCLPILLKFILAQEVGELNLVHPQPIQLNQLVQLIKGSAGESDDNQTEAESNKRAVLDTSRIERYNVLPTKAAIQQAVSKLHNVS